MASDDVILAAAVGAGALLLAKNEISSGLAALPETVSAILQPAISDFQNTISAPISEFRGELPVYVAPSGTVIYQTPEEAFPGYGTRDNLSAESVWDAFRLGWNTLPLGSWWPLR